MKIVVQFSGGKDSTVALLLALQVPGAEVVAVHNDMGDSFPHVLDFVHATCGRLSVPLVTSTPRVPVLESNLEFGLPSDLVPVWASEEADVFTYLANRPTVKVQSAIGCCARNLYVPLMATTLGLKPDEVWRGSRFDDPHVTVPADFYYENVKFCFPVGDWTEGRIYAYLQEAGVELPMHYGHGMRHSADCMECTGWLDNTDEHLRAKFTREHYPAKFERLKEKTALLEEAIESQQALRHNFTNEVLR